MNREKVYQPNQTTKLHYVGRNKIQTTNVLTKAIKNKSRAFLSKQEKNILMAHFKKSPLCKFELTQLLSAKNLLKKKCNS